MCCRLPVRIATYLGAVLAVGLPGLAVAQQPGNSEAAAETSIHGGWLVIAAYIILWVGLVGYVGWLAWRQSQLDEELEALETRLDEELGAVSEPND